MQLFAGPMTKNSEHAVQSLMARYSVDEVDAERFDVETGTIKKQPSPTLVPQSPDLRSLTEALTEHLRPVTTRKRLEVGLLVTIGIAVAEAVIELRLAQLRSELASTPWWRVLRRLALKSAVIALQPSAKLALPAAKQ